MTEADVLLVEDNHGDRHLIERLFEERSLPGTLHPVDSGDAALDWLHGRGEYVDAPRPDVVVLDLNLPATSGQAVLEEIKSDSSLKRIPVIVLTGSKSETDLVEAYESHANACLIKPVDPGAFGELFQSLTDFWVANAALPSEAERADRS